MCLLNSKIVRYKHRDTAGHVTQVLYVLEVYIICWLNSVTQLINRDRLRISEKCTYLPWNLVVGFLLVIKNLFMLSVRISSYGCKQEVWRAWKKRKSCTRLLPHATLASWVLSKLLKSIHNSIYTQLRARANSFITSLTKKVCFRFVDRNARHNKRFYQLY